MEPKLAQAGARLFFSRSDSRNRVGKADKINRDESMQGAGAGCMAGLLRLAREGIDGASQYARNHVRTVSYGVSRRPTPAGSARSLPPCGRL